MIDRGRLKNTLDPSEGFRLYACGRQEGGQVSPSEGLTWFVFRDDMYILLFLLSLVLPCLASPPAGNGIPYTLAAYGNNEGIFVHRFNMGILKNGIIKQCIKVQRHL